MIAARGYTNSRILAFPNITNNNPIARKYSLFGGLVANLESGTVNPRIPKHFKVKNKIKTVSE